MSRDTKEKKSGTMERGKGTEVKEGKMEERNVWKSKNGEREREREEREERREGKEAKEG